MSSEGENQEYDLPLQGDADARHRCVVDLSFGDAGKGTTVDWLARSGKYDAVVRFNGGAQAAHNVVTPDGRHHTFAQFGAGTLAGGDTPLPTILSRFMMVDLRALVAEAEHLASLGVSRPLNLLRVDRAALLTTPYHAAWNQAEELARGAGRHGSCGIGVGKTAQWALEEDAPRVGDGFRPAELIAKLARLRDRVLDLHSEHVDAAALPTPEELGAEYAWLTQNVDTFDDVTFERIMKQNRVIFEAAQGVLLDEWRGFHPHTTWSTTTTDNVHTLLGEGQQDSEDVYTVGILRTYTTRHGAGPLPSEDISLETVTPEPHNGTGQWQGRFRRGHFDQVLHRYALQVAGPVNSIVLTHADVPDRAHQAGAALKSVRGYRGRDGVLVSDLEAGAFGDLDHQSAMTTRLDQVGLHGCVMEDVAPDAWVDHVETALQVPVSVVSTAPTAEGKVVTGRS